MRLSLRMTASLAMTGLFTFGSFGAWLVVREQRDLRVAAEREMAFLGTSLRVGVENAMRDRQVADVDEAALRLEGVDTWLDVWVHDADGAVVSAPGGLPVGALEGALHDLAASAAEASAPRLLWWPEEAPTALLVVTPLMTDDGDLIGTLGLRRPVDDLDRDLRWTAGAALMVVGVFVLMSSVLGLAIGEVRLGRPLRELTAAMRGLRLEGATGTLDEGGDDEPREIATEFNRMVLDLRSERARADAEAAARREALNQLFAADRLASVGQLAAALAHEVGSPLQVLHGRARALEVDAEDSDRTRRHAAVLVRETERIARIVERLLSLTRRCDDEPRGVDLLEVVARVVELVEVDARRDAIELRVTGAAPPVVARADRLEQVVLNLLLNAMAASRPGGRIGVRVEGGPGEARLVVEDDGRGMTPEVADRCFEPLFTATPGGTGLGLAVVRSIVEEHGGRVSCTSEAGKGARFVVSLPAGEAT